MDKNDLVNHPAHYKGKTLEVIDVIEDFDLSYNTGNSVGYILRARKKEDELIDLRKAIWHLNRECEKIEEERMASCANAAEETVESIERCF